MLTTITITGADERTDLEALGRLATDHQRVEVGLLYTATPEGRPRYPGLPWLLRAVDALRGRCAVHVCGRAARRQLLAGELDRLTGGAARIQINGLIDDDELDRLSSFFSFRYQDFITQHNDANKRHARGTHPRHCLLVDGSGGRGLSPEEWRCPESTKAVGFAGGLGPDNLAAELPRIEAVAPERSWVDMEGKLRVNDWFDLGLARECAQVFDGFIAGHAASPRRPRP